MAITTRRPCECRKQAAQPRSAAARQGISRIQGCLGHPDPPKYCPGKPWLLLAVVISCKVGAGRGAGRKRIKETRLRLGGFFRVEARESSEGSFYLPSGVSAEREEVTQNLGKTRSQRLENRDTVKVCSYHTDSLTALTNALCENRSGMPCYGVHDLATHKINKIKHRLRR